MAFSKDKQNKQPQGKVGRSKRRADLIFVCVMLALPIVQFCIMWIGTNFNSILLAFKEYDTNFDYAWSMSNFTRVLNGFKDDEVIRESIRNSVLFWFCGQVVTLVPALLISFYFYKNYKFSKILKNIFFLPHIVAGVVTVTVFYYLVDRGFPQLMKNLFGVSATGLIVNNQTQAGVLLFYNVFYALASGFLFFSSAMCGIEESVSEAAQVDGASSMQELWHVTLPNIFPTLSVWFVASTANIFVSDFSMYAFFKTSNGARFNTIGYYFMQGLTTWGEREYPFFAAFGLVLTALACVITFSLRAIINRRDPFREQDGASAKKKPWRRKEETVA